MPQNPLPARGLPLCGELLLLHRLAACGIMVASGCWPNGRSKNRIEEVRATKDYIHHQCVNAVAAIQAMGNETVQRCEIDVEMTATNPVARIGTLTGKHALAMLFLQNSSM